MRLEADKSNETIYIRDEIAKCEDVNELRENILPLLKSQQEQWAVKINEIISGCGCSKSDFAKLVGASKASIGKWCNGSVPRNRETFIRIGLAAGYDIEKMNQLLVRYGRYPALYSKTLEDCVCIFVIGKNYGTDAVEQYAKILNSIRDSIIENSGAGDFTTDTFDEMLSEVENVDELEEFIRTNGGVFASAYAGFYSSVLMDIEANYKVYGNNVYGLASGQGWSSSLRQCVSAIKQRKWQPSRNKVISLGMHLSMDREQIDEILVEAHMEPLCAKNIFESVIIFILEDASISGMLETESDMFDPDTLIRYAKKVVTELDIPEMDEFISELSGVDDDEE